MKLLMLAPPGAGKGTQAARLAVHFSIAHIASGELLRAEVNAGTELGREASAYLDRGDLVPDRLVIAMVLEHCIAAARAGGFILDGFPRTLAQAEAAYEAAEAADLILDAVIFLEVSNAELRRRMLARAALEARNDDNGSVIEHRLAVYHEQTEPLLEFYDQRGLLHRINGEQSVDDVYHDVLEALSAFTH
jgi:adenylate kinase